MITFRNDSGFTLTEMLIALVIIGILLTIAVPQYLSVTRKAKETEAKMMLNQLHSLQESFYFEKDRYTSDFSELGFEQQKLISEGGKARYRIAIPEVDSLGYRATATSIVDFDKDGVYNVWEVTEDGIVVRKVPD